MKNRKEKKTEKQRRVAGQIVSVSNTQKSCNDGDQRATQDQHNVNYSKYMANNLCVRIKTKRIVVSRGGRTTKLNSEPRINKPSECALIPFIIFSKHAAHIANHLPYA